MSKGQDNGTTILLGLKGYSVGEVVECEERIVVKTEVKGTIKCPHCGSVKLYGHGMCQPREILHTWSNGRRVYLELHRRRWKCRDCKCTFVEGRALVRSHSRLTRQAEAEDLW
jgi:transposase